VVLSAFAMRLFYRFRYSYRSSTENAFRMRQVMIIDKQWKKILGKGAENPPLIKDKGIFWDENNSAVLAENKIIIHRQGKSYSLALPAKTRASMAIEETFPGTYLVILNLNWKYNHSSEYKAGGKEHSARIVAAVKASGGKL
jgi:hypothetical protein